MIPATAQTLAEILAEGISLLSTEQIDFNHPGRREDVRPVLNLFCYNIGENSQVDHRINQEKPHPPTFGKYSPLWFDISFLVSAWDHTALGEQRLLSEALMLLLRYRWLPEELLAPSLRGYGSLSMTISAVGLIDAVALWRALGVPLRPALYVTVTVPFNRLGQGEPNTPIEVVGNGVVRSRS
ncbi:Pvc16 family protein [Coleofasciculus sp. FACHB-1120]|uniref:Pvc16 family protein n=1 Tax=Coleofasciculus sp. FACHB-1120 TaxID=2692783 RepID=UPI00168A3D89|nr:Pvc16 family protein [Coleofasciculus sp. FACHB-1120]MBD2742218.1 DUF4255 domain-containing protein [Coleofasciculus sp. FACHB-1120]